MKEEIKENENQEDDLLSILNSIDLNSTEKKVIQVLGENELVFENGEFFLEETRNLRNKRKISRNTAKEILLDFVIKHKTIKKIEIIKE